MEGESNTTKPKEGVELKGGHEPAKMVGGRRIVTRERHSESEDKTTPKKPTEQAEEEEEEFGEDKPAKQASVSDITVYCFHMKYHWFWLCFHLKIYCILHFSQL